MHCPSDLRTVVAYVIMAECYLDQNKYIKEFNPEGYLNSYLCDPILFSPEISHLVHFYSSTFSGDSVSILEYSGGPSLLHMVPAARKASKIVFSDFLQQNRIEVNKWLANDPGAFDWTSCIEQTLILEGETPDEIKIQKRAAMLREKVHAVVSCDLSSSSLMERGYEGLVNCTGVLDSICSTVEQFSLGVKKLSSLVKGEGYLILNNDYTSESYFVGDAEFVTPLNVMESDIKDAFYSSEFSEVAFESYCASERYTLAIGHKKD